MLRLEGLDIRQGEFRLRVEGAEIADGEIVALIGPSGEGKSTLLSAIAGFLDPEAGRISWNGGDLTELAPGQRPVAVIFQDNNLFPHLNAFDNVALGLRPSLHLGAEERGKVQAALDRVGLTAMADRRPSELSGGQQARVALARVLVQGRLLWLLDEPFAALGPALRRDMLSLVRDVAEEVGATVLLVTHQIEDARAIADSVIVVAEGQVAAPMPTSDLLAAPTGALARYLGA